MAFGLYALIPRERIRDILSTLHEFSGIPIRLREAGGELSEFFGEKSNCCALIRDGCGSDEKCGAEYLRAGERAKEIGEAYIFTCRAEMSHIAYPLVNRGELLGTVIAGPFPLEEGSSDRESQSDYAGELCSLTPERVIAIKSLMEQLLSPLLPMERIILLQTKEKMGQQSKINETIQMYKEQRLGSGGGRYYSMEKELAAKVREGNPDEAKTILNELCAYIIYTNGADIEDFRVRALGMSSVLFRVLLESGAAEDRVYGLEKNYVSLLISEKKLEDMCGDMRDILESCISTVYNGNDRTNPYIRHALKYVAAHYSEPLTVTSLAEEVKLSPKHFSALFKRNVGLTFHEYLCRVRVEESKLLLLSSDYSLTDIAVAMGFPDQSYFCKAFKKIVGLTPGKYRNG